MWLPASRELHFHGQAGRPRVSRSHQPSIFSNILELSAPIVQFITHERGGRTNPSANMAGKQYQEDSHLFQAGALGWLEGLSLSDLSSGTPVCTYFGGIPYGSIPARFRRAQSLQKHSCFGTKDNPGQYNRPARVCPQPGWRGPPDQKLWDENCTQLNIYMPSGTAPKNGWPVFF